MSFDIILVFAILIIALILFTIERISFDISALMIMVTLLLTGILTPEETLAGFSNEATITIGAMFVLSEGIRQTGVLDKIGNLFSRLGQQNYGLAIVSMMLVIGLISAFINNTAAVAIFIPIVLAVALSLDINPSKLLIPLSYASMLGGVCTLIGTSTNILISSIAEQHDQAAFSMFEFTPLGIIFFIIGFAYLLFLGIRLIPERRIEQEATSRFEMNQYLTDIILEPGFKHYGQSPNESTLTRNLDLDVIQVYRKDKLLSTRGPKTILKPGDRLRIRGSASEIKKLLNREDISLKPTKVWHDVDLNTSNYTLVEAVLAPNSNLVGRKLINIDFPKRFGGIVLAIRHHGKVRQEKIENIRLSGGDSILLSLDHDRVKELHRNPSFVVVSELDFSDYRWSKMPVAVAILVGVVGVAALNIVPIVASAIVGSLLLVLTGCLNVEEAHAAINWKVIFLLAGLIPLGIAIEKTGAAKLIATYAPSISNVWGSVGVLSIFFLITMLLSAIISNQATAVLLAPIAVQTAQTLGVNARPFLIAVTFAASLSFITPIGYQTNTLVYGPGHYKFTDFTKVGAPLNLLFWIMATFLIPVFWPL